MKTSVLSDNFARAVKIATHAVAKKPRLAVLGNVLLSADDLHLTVAASHLDYAIAYRIGAKTDRQGAITVPPSALERDGETRLDMEVDDKTQILTATIPGWLGGPNDRHYTVKGIRASAFPVVPTFEHLDKPVVILPDGKALKAAIQYVCEVQADWGGRDGQIVYLAATGETLTLTAGNSGQIHRATLKADVAKDYRITLSVDSLKVLGKILGDKTLIDVYDCGPEHNPVCFAFDDVRPYKAMNGQRLENRHGVEMTIQTVDTARSAPTLPDNYLFAFECWPNRLDRALQRAKIFSETATLNVVHGWQYDSASRGMIKVAEVSLSAESEALGDVTSRLDIGYSLLPPQRELKFNVARLRDVLEVMGKIAKDETLTIRLSGPRAPILIEATQDNVSLAAAVLPNLLPTYAPRDMELAVEAADFKRSQDEREALREYGQWIKAAGSAWHCKVDEDATGVRWIKHFGRSRREVVDQQLIDLDSDPDALRRWYAKNLKIAA